MSRGLQAWLSDNDCPVLGMLHLMPLPGSSAYCGDLESIRSRLLADAIALSERGIDGLILENFGDAPFFPGAVPPTTVAVMAALAAEVRRTCDLPLGINVLRNDGCAALSIAQAVGASFIRVNVLIGARLTDQGIVCGIAHDLLRLRRSLGADGIGIFADVNVKHSAPLAARSLESEVHDLVWRGGADALIVTGAETGSAVDANELARVREAGVGRPVLVGSGVSLGNARDCRDACDGLIVGSAFEQDGVAGRPVDAGRVEALMATLT